MAAEDRILKILLQLKEETLDKGKVTGSLKEIEAQAVKTAAAVRTITDSNVLPAGFDKGDSARAVALRSELDARVAAKAAAAETVAVEAQGVALTEEAALAQARKTLQMERQIIVGLQLEAAEARIAGDNAGALKLEREADIRFRALTIQRSLNVSTEESIVLAERLVLAQEKSNVATGLAGVNLNKAKAEALTLSREIATGSVNARTMGAFLGSLGPTLTIAGLVGFELFQLIKHSSDEAERLAKEIAKGADEIAKQVEQWDRAARSSSDFGDVAKLGEKMQPEIDKLAAKLTEFRREQLSVMARFWDGVVSLGADAFHRMQAMLPGDHLIGGDSRPNQETKDTRDQAAEKELRGLLRLQQAERELSQQRADAATALRLEDPNDALIKQNAIVDQATLKYKALNDVMNTLVTGDLKGVNGEHAQALSKEITEAASDLDTQIKLKKELSDAADKENAAATVSTRRVQQDALNASLRESGLLLADIRNQQQLISQDPFLSTEAKQTLLANSYIREQQALLLEILKLKAAIATIEATGGPHEQSQIAALTAKLHALGFEYQSLGQKVKSLSGTGELRSDLTAWANSFGSTMHQVSGIITGTLNTAIAQTSQLLTDAIFRTGDWKSALLAVGEAGVKSIIQMFLQWVISRTLMSALNAIFGKADASVASKSAASSAAAWSPAAVSASIATEGTAALLGTTAYIAALVAGEGAAVGIAASGFKKGGYTGDGSADEIAGPAHKGEFYFTKAQTENIGLRRLYAMAHGAPHYDDGGPIEPGELPGAGDGPGPIYIGGMPYPPGWVPHVGPHGEPIVQVPHFVHDDGRLDPWTLGDDDMTLRDWGSGWASGAGSGGTNPYGLPGGPGGLEEGGLFPGDPRGLQNWPPTITINGGDGDPETYAWLRGFMRNGQPVYGDGDGNIYNAGGQPVSTAGGIPVRQVPFYYGAGYGSIRGEHILGGHLLGRDPVTGQPVYNPRGYGSMSDLYGGGAPAIDNHWDYASGHYVGNNTSGPNSFGDNPNQGGGYGGGSGGSDMSYAHPWAMLAGGGRLPGAPSRTDNMLAWVGSGEHVIKTEAAQWADQVLGPNFLDDINNMRIPVGRPHFVSGGRVGGSSSSSGGGGGGRQKLTIINVLDMKAAAKAAMRESDGEVIIVDHLRNSLHKLGLGAVNQ